MPPTTTFRTNASSSTASNNTTLDQKVEIPLVPSTRQQQTESTINSSTWRCKNEREYRLEVIQQPSRARMCGFGDKDRRPISPPPILKLLVRNQQGAILLPQEIDTSFFVVLCDCYDETGANPANIILHSVTLPTSSATPSATPSSSSSSSSYRRQQQKHYQEQQQQQASSSTPSLSSSTTSSSGTINKKTVKMKNLVGSCIASPSKLYNEQQELGIYFVFHDLSLRSEGRFRLIFSLIDIGSSDYKILNTDSISHVLTATKSDAFTAFTAKNFPGVVPPTQLSQCFARQGIKIPTRRDTKSKRMRKTSSEIKEFEHQQ
ncbi:velvet factor-domain-containing protein [Circinella umbellata]|nr:velvet factor-domain-containing protein [Circinella umbellata]